MTKLVPDQLKELWHSVETGQRSPEDYDGEQHRLLAEYGTTWKQALLLDGHSDLRESLVAELSLYLGCADLGEIQRRCREAAAAIGHEWQAKVDPGDRQSVERFYDEGLTYLYDLMWWHGLEEDNSPLAYTLALDFAQQHGSGSYLDFGAGVGSGGILFRRHGFEVTLADISTPLLRFSEWRFNLRGLPGQFIDTRARGLPANAFDLITAMDVFEHLADPVETVMALWQALNPNGYLLGRFHAELDDERPQHIVRDFRPTFECMRSLGLVEVWRDEWLWGHQVFQKR